jgi:quercetin dioxygenase-like cupin family protein
VPELPVVLCDTQALVAGAEPDLVGALWRLQGDQRDLDSNLIQLPAGSSIDPHTGPECDVLVHVLHGSGRLGTDGGEFDLRAGSLVWLPRRSRRSFVAGSDGLRYLTVHQRRPGLTVGRGPQT